MLLPSTTPEIFPSMDDVLLSGEYAKISQAPCSHLSGKGRVFHSPGYLIEKLNRPSVYVFQLAVESGMEITVGDEDGVGIISLEGIFWEVFRYLPMNIPPVNITAIMINPQIINSGFILGGGGI